jgi:RNA polymerase sigma-70 factor (ECF subfamily)
MEDGELQRVVPGVRTWESVQRGDPDALDRLFEHWMASILQWCRRLGGPRVDPEQAAQDICIVVLAKVGQVERPAQLPAWLFAVTRRVLARHRRWVWAQRWIPGVAPERPAPGGGPDQHAILSEESKAVQQILQEMPEDLRNVLVLADLDERPDTEVAVMLDLKVGTAKSRLRRARALFREKATNRGLGRTWGEE